MKFSADAAAATAKQPVDVTIDDVEACLHRLFIKADGTALRREDKKKAAELVPLLAEVARLTRNRPRGVLVDLCAGKSPLGLLSAALVLQPGWRVVVVDRDAARVDAARRAAIGVDCVVDVVVASVGDDQVHALVAKEAQLRFDIGFPVTADRDVGQFHPEFEQSVGHPRTVAVSDPPSQHLGSGDQDPCAGAHRVTVAPGARTTSGTAGTWAAISERERRSAAVP